MRHDEDFAEFVESAWPELVRLARVLAPDRDGGEDLAQAALLKTYRHWRSVQDPAAYTRTVMARLAIRAGRRRWRREIPTARLPEAEGPNPQRSVEESEALSRALADLPSEQRAVIVLRFFCDCTEAEIASAMGCPVGTVKSRTRRALATLRVTESLEEMAVRDE